jgi:hypothetical protein
VRWLVGKISPFSAFRLEDYPSQRQWISKLFQPLNFTMGQIVNALNGQITFGDNIPAFTKVLSGSNLSLPISFQVTSKLIPTVMTVGQASREGVPITMAGAWSFSGDTITVSELWEIAFTGNTALETGAKYSITLRFT